MKKGCLLLLLFLSVGLFAEQARPPIIPLEEVLEYTLQGERPDLVFGQSSSDLTILQNDDAELLKKTYTADSMFPYILITMSCYAIENNRPKCLEVLIQKGFNPEEFSRRGDTPMVYAARRGYVEMIRVLAKAGADVNKPVAMGHTNPLVAACEYGQVEVVKTLLELGADINYMTTTQWFPVSAVALHDRDDVLAILIEKGANLNVSSPKLKKTPLMVAADEDAVRCVQLLLANGVDKHAKSRDGWTAADFTYWSYDQDCVDSLKVLMEAGVGIRMKDAPWALQDMAENHSEKCLEYVLSSNRYNMADYKTRSSLYYDALKRRGGANTLRVLYNAKIPTQIHYGEDGAGNPFCHEEYQVSKLLRAWAKSRGADKASLDMILSFAKECGEEVKLNLFDISRTDNFALDKVRWMLACGANPQQRNRQGETFRDAVRSAIEKSNGVPSPMLANLLEELNVFWPDDNIARDLTIQTVTVEQRCCEDSSAAKGSLPLEIQFYPSKQPYHVLLKIKNNDRNTNFTFDNFLLPIVTEWLDESGLNKQHLLLDKLTVPSGTTVTLLVQFVPYDSGLVMLDRDSRSTVFRRRGQAYRVEGYFNVMVDNEKWSYFLEFKLRVPPITFSQTYPGSFKVIRVLEGEE